MKSTKRKVPDNPGLIWCWYRLGDMQPGLMYDLLAFRVAVFVVEQTCVYQELDGRDKGAEHLVVTQNGNVVACLRVLPTGVSGARARIGRVAVSKALRKRGIARLMVLKAIARIRKEHPSSGICLDAQTYLRDFYLSMGFQVCGDEFLEDGIPHVPMQIAN